MNRPLLAVAATLRILTSKIYVKSDILGIIDINRACNYFDIGILVGYSEKPLNEYKLT